MYLTRAAIVAIGLVSLAACGSNASPAATTDGASTPTQGISSSPPADCLELVGTKVDKDAECGNFESPGSAGCYPNGEQRGSVYYFSGESETVYGKTGGKWLKGPASMTITQMADALGC